MLTVTVWIIVQHQDQYVFLVRRVDEHYRVIPPAARDAISRDFLSPQPDDDAHDIAIADAPVMGNNIN